MARVSYSCNTDESDSWSIEKGTHACSVTQLCPALCDPMDCSPPGSSVHGDSPGKNTGVGYHTFLQGIFPTQGSNPGLPYYRQILYHLSHQGSPRIWEWVAYPISRDLRHTLMPGSSVLHSLPELAQDRVHCVRDAIQPSHPLPPPSPFAFKCW